MVISSSLLTRGDIYELGFLKKNRRFKNRSCEKEKKPRSSSSNTNARLCSLIERGSIVKSVSIPSNKSYALSI